MPHANKLKLHSSQLTKTLFPFIATQTKNRDFFAINAIKFSQRFSSPITLETFLCFFFFERCELHNFIFIRKAHFNSIPSRQQFFPLTKKLIAKYFYDISIRKFICRGNFRERILCLSIFNIQHHGLPTIFSGLSLTLFPFNVN